MDLTASYWVERLSKRYPHVRVWALGFHRYSTRLYFILSPEAHRPRLQDAVTRFLHTWGAEGCGSKRRPHFRLSPCSDMARAAE